MAAMSLRAIKETALKGIKPQTKKVHEQAISMVAAINREIEKQGFSAVAVPGGSVAKDTYLKNDFDVDIFVKFDLSYGKQDLSKLLAKILTKWKTVKVHGSRDYFHIKDTLQYEIVPVLDIRHAGQAQNVTDMSPMHVRWVKDQVRKRAGLSDEIRLAKQFCKAANVYGAESFIGGFSGHVLDILVIHYGGFSRFLKNISVVRKGAVIDPKDHHHGKAKKILNEAKLQSPLIVIDPILPERNAAAALTDDKFQKLKVVAKQFLKKPDLSFFQIQTITVDELLDTSKDDQLILLEARPLGGKTDIVGGKLLKTFEHIGKELEAYDFTLIASDWQWDKKGKALFWYILPRRKLRAEKTWEGPLLTQRKHVAGFKKKHKKTFTRGKRIYATVRRKHIEASSLIDDLMRSGYVRQRVKKIVLL